MRPSGITYGLDFELALACLEMRVPPSEFRRWDPDDQNEVLAALRTKARMEAALVEKQSRAAEQRAARGRGQRRV